MMISSSELNQESCLCYYRRNILETQNPDYLRGCHYNSSDDIDKLCPVFTLGTIVSNAGANFSQIAVKVTETAAIVKRVYKVKPWVRRKVLLVARWSFYANSITEKIYPL